MIERNLLEKEKNKRTVYYIVMHLKTFQVSLTQLNKIYVSFDKNSGKRFQKTDKNF